MAPGLLAFNQLLALAAENKAKDAAVNMYELMITKGPIDPDEKSFGAMINCAWVRAFAFLCDFRVQNSDHAGGRHAVTCRLRASI